MAYRQAVQTQLVATIAESYHTLLMLDEQLAITRQTLANWNETIAVLETLAHNWNAVHACGAHGVYTFSS